MVVSRLSSMISLLILISPILYSQVITGENNKVSEDGFIRWVAQYPPDRSERKSTFFQKLEKIIFGPEPELIFKPVCAISDDHSKIWILNQGNGKLIAVSEDKTYIPPELSRKNLIFPSLVSACIIPGKGIIFTDSSQDKVYLLAEDGEEIREFCDQNALNQPTGVAYSSKTGQIWIVQTASHKISIYSPEGILIKSLGERGSQPGEFNFPTHIWIDKNGTIYVVDAMNFRVQIFNSSGEYLNSFGEIGDATGSFARPKGIATDSYGNIYVADALFNNIQIFDSKGMFLYYFGNQGNGKGQFWMPAGIFIDKNDYIYVSDSFNNRVQVFLLLKKEQ